ncbi:hypothetical protein JCM10213v2_003347 [Rhodosporidiobolus nylandii]
MSFPALPYELVSHIASFLDPSPFFSAHEAPSITRARRVAGRALALVSRNAVLPGREMIWRRVVVGMHRNPEMLDRLLGSEEDSAPTELVRELVFLAGPKTARTALERELGKLLPRFGRLELLSLAATPGLASLTLSLSVGPLATRMPDLVALLPFLGELRRLKFLVQPITSAPLILSPSHALQPALLAALPAALEEFELDIDFCAPAGQLAADVRELLDSRLEDGRLQSWMSVEWEEGMAMRRAVGLVRVVRDGRAQWSMMDGEEEEGED